MKYQRRTDDDRVAELAAKIEGIRVRAARKVARSHPAVRLATAARKAIEKAIEAQPDGPLLLALEQALVVMSPALDVSIPKPEPDVAVEMPKAARKTRLRSTATP